MRGLLLIFSSKRSFLFRNRIIEVSVNHLLLQILSNNFMLSCIRFCNWKITHHFLFYQTSVVKSVYIFSISYTWTSYKTKFLANKTTFYCREIQRGQHYHKGHFHKQGLSNYFFSFPGLSFQYFRNFFCVLTFCSTATLQELLSHLNLSKH